MRGCSEADARVRLQDLERARARDVGDHARGSGASRAATLGDRVVGHAQQDQVDVADAVEFVVVDQADAVAGPTQGEGERRARATRADDGRCS